MANSSVMDMSYNYTAGQNNGRITLATAQATNNSWGNAYTYDGFGNLTAATVTAGSAPHFSTSVDPATNRSVSPWSGYYDANGNPGYYNGESQYGTLYDVENKPIGSSSIGPPAYDPSGKRVVMGNSANGAVVYFYGIDGKRLGTYSLPSGATTFSTSSLSLYFGGKLMRSGGLTTATDRLGSVRATINGVSPHEQMTYWPYGQERTSTPDGREKVATYYRDSVGQDYADQRYYGNVGGRFSTPDPSTGVDPKNPTTWNKYAYASGDPVNRFDPRGLEDCSPDEGDCRDPGDDPWLPYDPGGNGPPQRGGGQNRLGHRDR